MKKYITRPARRLRRHYREWDRQRRAGRYRDLPLEEIFRDIHKRRRWRSSETVSGKGSGRAGSAGVRRALPALCAELGIRSVLDAACGDYQWMRSITPDIDDYLGVDIVPELIEENNRRYASERVRFELKDICRDPLPRADLILCRDCLVHLSEENVKRAIDNFKQSGSRYLLVTTFTRLPENRDIVNGLWRPVNLELAPYRFPKALQTLADGAVAGSAFSGSAVTGSAFSGSAVTGSAVTGSAFSGSAVTGSAVTGSARLYHKALSLYELERIEGFENG